MIVATLEKLIAHQDLSRREAYEALRVIFNGDASEAQTAGLLIALAVKGETAEELVGFASAMREAAGLDLGAGRDGDDVLAHAARRGWRLVDTCGTGGNARKTFNVSTAAAFVAAGAGVPVAKHGNRSHTSLCGSADVMAALGVDLEMPAGQIGACLREVGIAFLYAPLLHRSMRHVQPVRRELKVRTIFNLLGPLTNPAGAEAQVVGVPSAELIPKMVAALLELGVKRAFVVHGEGGLGEITTTGITEVGEVRDGSIHAYSLDMTEFGIRRARGDELAGGDVAANRRIVLEVLQGQRGARRDIVIANAAAALVAGNRAPDLAAALPLAEESIDSGAALAKVRQLAEFTQTHRESATSHPGAS